MNENYDDIINKLKADLDKAKNTKIRAEARLEQLNRQKQELINEISQLGINPQQLTDEIERLKKEIDALIEKANSLLPQELLKGVE